MINTKKLQELRQEISYLQMSIERIKKELEATPDGYIYIIAMEDKVLYSKAVNFIVALEKLQDWGNDELCYNVTLWTNDPNADKVELGVEHYFIKFASISELQDLSEGKG